MIKITDKTMCTGCTACLVSCPIQCIEMVRDCEGFLYPTVNEKNCIDCGLCEKKCPVVVQDNINTFTETEAFAAKTSSDEIRGKSSSGGIFSELATWVLQQGGVVFGAGFDEQFGVHHICVKTESDLSKLRGSKYLQSSIGQSYVEVKTRLESQQWVLFSGTPCQIAGLYAFLGKDFNRLITQDIICHGVPSPNVWKEYLSYRCKRSRNKMVTDVNFRDKSTGWKNYSLTIKYGGGDVYSCPASKDFMMRAFLKNLCLRPSCYRCAFKQSVKLSDVTLADFWGIENVMPEWNKEQGVSLMLLNSPKGKMIFSEIQSQIIAVPVERDEALKYNPSATHSSPKPPLRDAFMLCVEQKGFYRAAKKYLNISLFQRMVARIKILFRKSSEKIK